MTEIMASAAEMTARPLVPIPEPYPMSMEMPWLADVGEGIVVLVRCEHDVDRWSLALYRDGSLFIGPMTVDKVPCEGLLTAADFEFQRTDGSWLCGRD